MANKNISNSLVGVWELESYQLVGSDGVRSILERESIKGRLILSECGHISVTIHNNQKDTTQVPSIIAYSGEYTVRDERLVITVFVASKVDYEGKVIERMHDCIDDRLKLRTCQPYNGAIHEVAWRKIVR